ncbi:hypothetical protein BST63_16560 [Bradyrhizobium canariense]|uniref:Uncharacterized protein n=1 Tax=Bradyrhizobium canariense TaxID=255045 RepID=A0ABX3X3M2_9BRAD|nr:hypothetical protein BSR47_21105 [Bradyrhizobium canariense]OSJ28764.1 hypothetical protein BST63_16560 [Bradyrhizobium canariense]
MIAARLKSILQAIYPTRGRNMVAATSLFEARAPLRAEQTGQPLTGSIVVLVDLTRSIRRAMRSADLLAESSLELFLISLKISG